MDRTTKARQTSPRLCWFVATFCYTNKRFNSLFSSQQHHKDVFVFLLLNFYLGSATSNQHLQHLRAHPRTPTTRQPRLARHSQVTDTHTHHGERGMGVAVGLVELSCIECSIDVLIYWTRMDAKWPRLGEGAIREVRGVGCSRYESERGGGGSPIGRDGVSGDIC